MKGTKAVNKRIAVAGTGYVGLSLAVLLAQNNKVIAVDIIPEKVELVNNTKSSIQDDYIEQYLREKKLDWTATVDEEEAYKNAADRTGKDDASPSQEDVKNALNDTKLSRSQKRAIWKSYGWKTDSPW